MRIETSGPEARNPGLEGDAQARRTLEARNHVLEKIATDAPLTEVLEILTRASEELVPAMVCSVLLLGPDGCLHHGAAPSLPEAYREAIDGLPIGPLAGSCGTAAYTRTRVIVEDVTTHPAWVAYWQLAVAAGLRACWSEPILSSKGDVLGTFAMYYRTPRSPERVDIDFIYTSAHIAGVAIERDRTEKQLLQYQHRLEDLVQQRTAELERVNAELRQALQDVKVLRGLVPICSWCKRIREDGGFWEQIEQYVSQRSEAVFTHGICPECATKFKAAPEEPTV